MSRKCFAGFVPVRATPKISKTLPDGTVKLVQDRNRREREGIEVRAVRIPLRPTTAVWRKVWSYVGSRRAVWNWAVALLVEDGLKGGAEKALAEKEGRKPAYGKLLTAQDLQKRLVILKSVPKANGGLPWLAGQSKCIGEGAIQDACEARDRWLFPKAGSRKVGKPRFQTRSNQAMGVRLTGVIVVGPSTVALPTLGKVKIACSARDYGVPGRYVAARLVVQDGKLYASVLVERERPEVVPSSTLPTLGIDVGVRVLVSGSDGSTWDHPESLEKAAKRERKKLLAVRRKQRAADKQAGPRVKGQKRAEGRRMKLARQRFRQAAAKTARVRLDSARQVAADIAKKHAVVAVEALRVRNMTRSVKGKGRAAKAGLNRALANSGFGMLFLAIENALQKRGGRLIRVDPRNTSKTCSGCGWMYDIGKSIVFRCRECGAEIDRDLNAARNILERGCSRVALGCGETKNAREGRGARPDDSGRAAMPGARAAGDPVAYSGGLA